MVQLYLLAGAIVTAGFLWFFLVRPIAVAVWDAYADWREPPHQRVRASRRRRVMSRPMLTRPRMRAVKPPVFVAKLNAETAETPQRVAENASETVTFGETQALARLVASGKLGLTDAVRIGADAKSGEKYQKRSQEIKAAVAQIQDRYPRQTPEQAQLRRELGLPKP